MCTAITCFGARVSRVAQEAGGTDAVDRRVVAPQVSVLDITERKHAEELLRERETQLRDLADNLPGGVVYRAVRRADGSNYFPYVSAGLARTFGLAPEAAIATGAAVYNLIAPEGTSRGCARRATSRSGRPRRSTSSVGCGHCPVSRAGCTSAVSHAASRTDRRCGTPSP